MDLFVLVLGSLICACFILHLYTRQIQPKSTDVQFKRFQRKYLLIYLLAAGKNSLIFHLVRFCLSLAGDWLQGPHVYALYESYGIQKHEIEILFIAGFGSSMIFGTLVASLADK